MKRAFPCWIFALALGGTNVSADTHYVAAVNSEANPPYTNWATAAKDLQSAVDAAASGDTVLVTNGQYPGDVVVDKRLSLLSVNGPAFTWIDGGTPCVVLAEEGASLTGFTVANGVSDTAAGGVTCASTGTYLTNCIIKGNRGRDGGGVFGGTLYDCTLTANLSRSGGAACGSILTNCTLVGNYAIFKDGTGGLGGGAYGSVLDGCSLSGNLAYQGGGAYSCTLYRCTVSSNQVQGLRVKYPRGEVCLPGVGGGVNGSRLYNSRIIGNSAVASQYGGGNYAGGAAFSLAFNCVLTGNSADEGGGAVGGVLYNCTVTGNSANMGGGLLSHTYDNPTRSYNSIVWDNHAATAPNFDAASTLTNCCTSPLPDRGEGNIDDPPLFTDYPAGDLHLQPDSACINSGRNALVHMSTDFEGMPRIVRGSVDIGAYEYQGPGTRISCAWLKRYGLATDGSLDFVDSDADGMSNWQEWVAGTCPTNAQSVLALACPSTAGTNIALCWKSSVGVIYRLERTADARSPFSVLVTNIPGLEGTTTYTDTNTGGSGTFFYRVGVSLP